MEESWTRRTWTRAPALAAGALAVAALAVLVLSAPPASAGHGGVAPTCAIELSGSQGEADWFRSSVGVTLSTTNAQYVNFSSDGGASQTYFGPFNVFGEGPHTITCEVTDHNGTMVSLTRTFTIDYTVPSCGGSVSGSQSSSGWYTSGGVWSMTTSENYPPLRYTNYTLNGTGPFPYASPITLPDGTNSVACEVTDRAGNAYVQTYYIPIDRSPPTACGIMRVYDPLRSADAAARNGWYGILGAATYGAQVYFGAQEQGSGVSTFTITIGGAGSQVVGPGNYLTMYGEGRRSVTCEVRDTAGHVATNTFDLAIDGTRPTCRGAYTGAPGTAGWYTSGAFVLTASDDSSGVWFINTTRQGADSSREVSSFQYEAQESVTDEGFMTVSCRVVDNAGLVSAASSFQVKLDRTPPACDAHAAGRVGAGEWFLEPPDVFLNATDAQSGVGITFFSINGSPPVSYKSPVRITSEGATPLACRALDRAGNEGTSTLVVRLDTKPPAVCQSLARDSQGKVVVARREWYAKALDFDLASRDETSGLATAEFRLDGDLVPGVQVRGQEARVTLRIDARGEHSVSCTATDEAGNVAKTVSVPVNIDDTLPTCTGDMGGANEFGWHRAGATLALSASDTLSGLDTFRYALDGGAPRPYDAPIPIVGDGNHRVECMVEDIAGNRVVKTFDLRVDATPPECGVAGLDVDEVHAFPAVVRIETRDNTSGVRETFLSVNGGPEGIYTGPLTLQTPGVHEYTCRVVDNAGNERVLTLDRVRVDAPSTPVQPAALPLAQDAKARTAQPIPGAGAWAAVGALGAALALCRRK